MKEGKIVRNNHKRHNSGISTSLKRERCSTINIDLTPENKVENESPTTFNTTDSPLSPIKTDIGDIVNFTEAVKIMEPII